MSENRYNVFNPIHKGLRGMLFDTAIRLQQTDLAQPEARATVEQLEQLLRFLMNTPSTKTGLFCRTFRNTMRN
ncbi:hypothetical protein GCM10027299_39340 [Larkinella ripae]